MIITSEMIARRRAFLRPGYCTLADVGLEGEYVSPLQISSSSPTGPVLLAYHWLDAKSAIANQVQLRECGYLKNITFNKVVDRALSICGLNRASIYMTQVFHLLPPTERSAYIPVKYVDASFEEITCFELRGRKIITLGWQAARACQRGGVEPSRTVSHPSARGRSQEDKAGELAAAIKDLLD